MKSSLFPQTATPNGTAAEAEEAAFADPWEALDEGRGKSDNWLLSYIDILTLFLTLFVVLLALQPKNEAPPVDADPGELRVVAPQPIERQTAPPTLTVQAEPRQESEIIDAPLDLPAVTDSAHQEEVGSDQSNPFSVLAELARSIDTPLIYLLGVEQQQPGLEDVDPLPDAANPGDDLSAVTPAAEMPDETAASAQPAPPESSRDQVRLFMTKLAQLQLDDRVRVSEVAEGVYLEVSDNILFALGSADLKHDGAALLDELAQLLFEHSGIVSVEGHTDDRPIATSRFPSNWELSSGRATTVTRYLIGKGLDPARLRAVGYADTRPLESNATSAGRARNRRVALIVEIPEL